MFVFQSILFFSVCSNMFLVNGCRVKKKNVCVCQIDYGIFRTRVILEIFKLVKQTYLTYFLSQQKLMIELIVAATCA